MAFLYMRAREGTLKKARCEAFTAPFLSGRHLDSQVSRSQLNEAIKNEPLVLLLGLHKTAFPVKPLEKNPVWTSMVWEKARVAVAWRCCTVITHTHPPIHHVASLWPSLCGRNCTIETGGPVSCKYVCDYSSKHVCGCDGGFFSDVCFRWFASEQRFQRREN